jgi:hypothetical protein
LTASLLIPALPLWDDVVLISVLGGMWLALAIWAVIPVAAFMLAIRCLSERTYGLAFGWLSVPAAGIFLFFFATDFGENLRYRLNKDSYDRVVADAHANRCKEQVQAREGIIIDGIDCDPMTVIFTWGGFGAIWYGIVYDAGDQIIKPPQERSISWKTRPIGSLLSCSSAKRALGDHYFLAGGSYTGGNNDCG